MLGENARPSYVEVLFHAANYTKNSVPLAAVAVNCDPPAIHEATPRMDAPTGNVNFRVYYFIIPAIVAHKLAPRVTHCSQIA